MVIIFYSPGGSCCNNLRSSPQMSMVNAGRTASVYEVWS